MKMEPAPSRVCWNLVGARCFNWKSRQVARLSFRLPGTYKFSEVTLYMCAIRSEHAQKQTARMLNDSNYWGPVVWCRWWWW